MNQKQTNCKPFLILISMFCSPATSPGCSLIPKSSCPVGAGVDLAKWVGKSRDLPGVVASHGVVSHGAWFFPNGFKLWKRNSRGFFRGGEVESIKFDVSVVFYVVKQLNTEVAHVAPELFSRVLMRKMPITFKPCFRGNSVRFSVSHVSLQG